MVVVVGLATMDITRVKNPRTIAMSAEPDGRLWLTWREGTKVKAVHTNAAATRLGAIGSWAAPRGTNYLWHTQVTRTLSVTADPGSIRRGGRVTFTVADAGDPVAGARVRFGSRQGHPRRARFGRTCAGDREQGHLQRWLCIGARALTAAEQSPAGGQGFLVGTRTVPLLV